MFRILLVFLTTLAAGAGFCQPAIPDWSGPSEHVREDPNQVVTSFTASTPSNQRVTISWMVNGKLPDFFAIERSVDGKDFEVLSVMNDLSTRTGYAWTDEAPASGRSFYRIRYAYGAADPLYSKTITVAVAGNATYKFYPNPVDHILIVRSEAPLDVHILDGQGKVRLSETGISGLRTINLSSLEKGIYLIRFSNKLINVMSQEKLVKN